jgi:hypothetical protein
VLLWSIGGGEKGTTNNNACNGRLNGNTNIEFDAARKTTENFDRTGWNMKRIEIVYKTLFPTSK